MRAWAGVAAIALAAGLALSGCGSRDDQPRLMNPVSKEGPDEFGIVPAKPLEMPKDLASLPVPTPGGGNRADQNPEADAIIALGGRPPAPGAGVPASDGALYAHAARFGVDGNIRQTLASEDLEWRRDNKGRILERLFNVTVYYKAYAKMQLDQHAELARWRRAGARTPSAPPDPASLK